MPPHNMSCLEGPEGIVSSLRPCGFYVFYLEPCQRRGDPPVDANTEAMLRARQARKELRLMAALSSTQEATELVTKVENEFVEHFQKEILHTARLAQQPRLNFTYKAKLEEEVAGALQDKHCYEEQASNAEQ